MQPSVDAAQIPESPNSNKPKIFIEEACPSFRQQLPRGTQVAVSGYVEFV